MPELSNDLWVAACEDAELDSAAVELFQIEGLPPRGELDAWGAWFDPGDPIRPTGGDFPLSRDKAAELESRGARDRTRVVVYTGAPIDVVTGFVRHELEHVRQQQRNKPGMTTSAMVQNAIRRRHGGKVGSGRIYNLLPREMDANSAASSFVKRVLQPDVADRLASPFAALFRQYPPADPQTLSFRAFCLAYVFGPEFEAEIATVGRTRDQYLESMDRVFVEAWGLLAEDAELNDWIRAAISSEPSAAQIVAAGDRPGFAWEATLRQYIEAYNRAMRLLDWPGPFVE